mmetsp:Transcript_2214/g.5282  ORF Transcript_2214/g.5282 Transcript_2214/m.5282 type:complete len:204 (+) Transcript_2214:1147-1758(+)
MARRTTLASARNLAGRCRKALPQRDTAARAKPCRSRSSFEAYLTLSGSSSTHLSTKSQSLRSSAVDPCNAELCPCSHAVKIISRSPRNLSEAQERAEPLQETASNIKLLSARSATDACLSASPLHLEASSARARSVLSSSEAYWSASPLLGLSAANSSSRSHRHSAGALRSCVQSCKITTRQLYHLVLFGSTLGDPSSPGATP